MKLTRKQELALIDMGFTQLLRILEGGSGNTMHNLRPRTSQFRKHVPWNKGKHGRKWTAERRKKFSETMKKKWANRDK